MPIFRRFFLGAVIAGAAATIATPTPAGAQPAGYRCPITFYLEDDRPPVGIADLAFDVAYTPPALRFVGIGANVACTRLVQNALALFDDDDHGVLHIDFSTTAAISSFFQPLAVCTTESTEIPVGQDFAVTIVEQSKVGGGDVTPPVPVQLLLPVADDCDPVAAITTSTTTTTVPSAGPECGDPTADSAITATDALFALNAAVGLTSCALCVCDVDGSGGTSASDALILLKLAVGESFELACGLCVPDSR